jgi:hypothetical protein
MQKVLSSKEGRLVLWELLCRSGVFRSSFSQDSHQTAFHEGERNIGLVLLAQVNEANALATKTMAEEAREEEEKYG